MPCMKFLFVRPYVCRRLPSDSTSRRTPLPWAMRFPLLGLARDLQPLANAHAERTTKKVKDHSFGLWLSRGAWRIRTAVDGFADRWLSHSSKAPWHHFWFAVAKVQHFICFTKCFAHFFLFLFAFICFFLLLSFFYLSFIPFFISLIPFSLLSLLAEYFHVLSFGLSSHGLSSQHFLSLRNFLSCFFEHASLIGQP